MNIAKNVIQMISFAMIQLAHLIIHFLSVSSIFLDSWPLSY